MAMPVLDNEEKRLKTLERYEILDSAPEFAYDEITELAAGICKCPVAFISIISEDRQWFKSRYGIPSDLTETPRDMSVCTTTISQSDLLIASYVRKLVTELSGGVFGYLDSVLERHSFDEFGELI